MEQVVISPKYQIVIPKAVRDRLKLKPGQRVFVMEREGSIRVLVSRSLQELRGMARGVRWEESDRDHTDRL